MPREMMLRLEVKSKTKHGLKVDTGTAWFLKQANWTVAKKARDYCYVQPPSDQKVGKTIDLKLSAPTDDEIIELATQLHAEGVPAFRVVNGWPFKYWPAHTNTITTKEVDPFTGDDIGIPVTTRTPMGAVCSIGLMLIWQAEVRWNDLGEPVLKKYPKREIALTEDGQGLLLDT